MSKKISKANGKKFVDDVCKRLTEELGAKVISPPFTDSFKSFELETKAGKLELNVPIEQNYVYTVFSRFDDEKRASKLFACNPHSGKYNFHLSPIPIKEAVDCAIAVFKQTLPE